MKKDLVRRLELLEGQRERKNCPVAYWCRDQALLATLEPGQRIVHDIYRIRGNWGQARARVVADPSDVGRTCERGGYLEDVIRELHRTCEWRDRGECHTCEGLSYLFADDDPGHT